jgi:formate dehydrogenase subunit gamma
LRGRIALGSLLLLATVAVAAPVHAQQQTPSAASPRHEHLIDPDSRAVSEGTLLRESLRIEGSILIPDERGRVLIQPAGRVWDYYHEVLLRPIGVVVIFGMVLALVAGYLFRGQIRITAGRSGTKVRRFNAVERLSHWLTAFSFIVLALTGLNITFGKVILRPLIGPDAFSVVAQYAKYAHDYMSFSFILGLVLIVAIWVRDNVPRKMDLVWLKEGGGIIGSKHPTAGRFNAGQKLIFWFVVGAGAAAAGSGLLLLFPFYVTNIAGMQVAQVVHSLIAIAFIAVILAHIYIGTVGMEGALEAMGTGSVDLNWIKQHHRAWLEDEVRTGRIPQQALAGAPPQDRSSPLATS